LEWNEENIALDEVFMGEDVEQLRWKARFKTSKNPYMGNGVSLQQQLYTVLFNYFHDSGNA